MAQDKIIEVSAYMNQYIDPQQPQYKSPLRWFVFYELYKRNAWVRAAVDKIVTRGTKDKYRLIDEDNPDNPELIELEAFLDRVNDRESATDLFIGVLTDLLIYGRAYLYIEATRGGAARTATGKDAIAALWGMDTRITYPVTDGHGNIVRHEQHYNGQCISFDNEEVLYFNLPNAGSEAMGLSPLETLVDALAVEMEAEQFNARLFANNMNMGAVLDAGENATEADAKKLQAVMDRKHTGAKNAHKTVVTFGGARLLKDGAATVKDIAFQVLFQLTQQKVGSVYKVPVSLMIGDGTGTNKATASILDKGFWEGTVRPLLSQVFAQFTRQFIQDAWGSDTIVIKESALNVLPSGDEIDTVLKIAQLGLPFNKIMELIGQEALANGDFPVIWTGGGYLRLDKTALPGLGNPDITPEDAQAEIDAAMAQAQGLVPADAGAAPVDGAAPTDGTVPTDAGAAPTDGTAPADTGAADEARARILDLTLSQLEQEFAFTRSLLLLDTVQAREYIVRRKPVNPGTRGGNGYFDANGVWHYGAPGAAKYNKAQGKKQAAAAKAAQKRAASAAAKAGRKAASDAKKAQHQKDAAAKKAQREKDRAAKEKARAEARQRKEQLRAAKDELRSLEREANDASLSDSEFLNKLSASGWKPSNAGMSTPEEARAEALKIAQANPDAAVAIMAVGNLVYVLVKPISSFQSQAGADNIVKAQGEAKEGEQVQRASFGTGGEQSHSYMSSQISNTRDAVDSVSFSVWAGKVQSFTGKS